MGDRPSAHGCADGFFIMEKHENFTYDGVTLLQVRISLPTVSGAEEITQFYEEMGEASYAFCRETLFLHARTCYENDPDPRRYLHFPPFRYYLQGETTYRSEALLSVRLEAMLARQGTPSRKILNVHNFSLPDGLLLSDRNALSAYYGRRISKKQLHGISSVLLNEHVPLVLRNGAWEPFDMV